MTDEPHSDEQSPEALLVGLLVILAFVTGVVDAVSFLRLDQVFVGNMTGNVLVLGFAVAGSPGFSWSTSLAALVAFVAGAAMTARLPPASRSRMLAGVVGVEAALCIAATLLTVVSDASAARYASTVLLALAMGAQNAVVRGLAVPDMTTTVLTTTLTALAADGPGRTGPASPSMRRVGAVLAMLAGAVTGALLVLETSTPWALGVAVAALGVVSLAGFRVRFG